MFIAKKLEVRLKMGFAIAAVVLLLTSIVPFQTARMSREIGQEVEQSQGRVELVHKLLAGLQAAEAAQRGFLLTGHEEFLEPYHAASLQLQELRTSFVSRLGSDPGMAEAAARLEDLVALRLETLRLGIAVRRSEGLPGAERLVSSGTSRRDMDEIRKLAMQLDRRERAHSALLLEEREQRARINAYAGLMVTGLDLVLLAYLLYLFAGLARARRDANTELRETEISLNQSLTALRERNQTISLIAQLGRALDAPSSLDELYRIVAAQGARLLPGTSWGVYAYRNSRDLLELKAAFGDSAEWVEAFEPEECWALRRGQPHESRREGGLVCEHFPPELALGDERRLRCIPLIAHGEVLGLLALRSAAASAGEENADESTLEAIAEQLSLSISNMRLREALRLQSILDPLTGLFNRRYLDETLRRELARAKRARTSLAVIMLDLDHFKRINDDHGHDVGDSVLRTVAQQLKASVRASDVACRYGGEEFALVLPDCTKADAASRAESILESIRTTPIRTASQTLRPVTASLGVAVYPEDAIDGELLIRAADRALYQAKHGGRNRVVATAAIAPADDLKE